MADRKNQSIERTKEKFGWLKNRPNFSVDTKPIENVGPQLTASKIRLINDRSEISVDRVTEEKF